MQEGQWPIPHEDVGALDVELPQAGQLGRMETRMAVCPSVSWWQLAVMVVVVVDSWECSQRQRLVRLILGLKALRHLELVTGAWRRSLVVMKDAVVVATSSDEGDR